MTEQNVANQPPIDHLSHSSLGLLLRNPLAWKKKYMLKIYESTMSPSGVVGQACHKALEVYLKGECADVNGAIDEGMKVLDSYSDVAIDFGKTGSREKMLKDYTAAVNFYFDEIPDWDKREVLHVEESFTQVIHNDEGDEMPLPAKAYADVIWRSKKKENFADKSYPKGSLFIEDHKFVRSFTDPEDLTDPTKLSQSFFNFTITREELKEEPVAMLYRETKISKNKNGDAQSQYYVIDFNEIRGEFQAMYQLYVDAVKFILNPNAVYLPNPSDMFDGKDSWLAYRDNLITAEAPKVVHKTKADTIVVEKKYQPSAPDKASNRNLEPEEKIRVKLQEFGIAVKMHETHRNSSVVMYTLKPSRGVRMSSIEKHAKDIAIALEAKSIRVQAPIMGTDKVGIEVPNEDRQVVPFFVDGVPSEKTGMVPSTLNIPVGMDVYGNTVTKDLREMPHLLIAGSTGSGKSVMLNVILHSLIAQNTPEELNLVLIDPKRVELMPFADEPHVQSRIIHKHGDAIKALKWLVGEMEDRYEKLQKAKYRNIEDFNADQVKQMPKLVVVIDEFASLILTKEVGEPSEAELMIVRLAQEGRAAGIHLVIATQRPSVDVVTGLIKANLPTRIAFMTSSRTDSQIVLDVAGAEELVGKGDMLFLDPSKRGLQRLQGYYA
jgi:hypothetical protein